MQRAARTASFKRENAGLALACCDERITNGSYWQFRIPMTVEPVRAMLVPMCMTSLRKLLLVWMVAWLPVSGAIASAMPIAAMSRAPMPVADMGETVTSASPSPLPCHGTSDTVSAATGGSCTHCVLCHLAGALMLPFIPALQGLAASHNFVATPLSPQTSFIPELISPPPRAL